MIHFDQVTKRYGGRDALAGLTLTVGAGEVVALVGPNGAGKSTALKLAVGIVLPSTGAVRVGGYDVAREGEKARGRLGYVPQRLAFPEHVTCRDLCRLVADLRGVEIARATRTLDDIAPGARLDARVRDLSGGQRQRLSLALALVDNPDGLVLDEPSISLDADGAEIVGRCIRAARARGAAVLFASHHLHEVAMLADRIVLLQGGRVVAQRSARELREPAALMSFYHSTVRGAAPHAA